MCLTAVKSVVHVNWTGMNVRNPATGEVEATYEEDTDADVETALDTATETFHSWRDRPLCERETLLAEASEVLRKNKRTYAQTMTTEMGKPISQALAEVEKCAWVCEHYAEHASE